MTNWQRERRSRDERLDAGRKLAQGKIIKPEGVTPLLEGLIRRGDRIEGKANRAA